MIGPNARMQSLRFAARRPVALVQRRSICLVKAFLQKSATQTPSDTVIPVTFTVEKPVSFGQNVRVVGSSEILGGWEVDKGFELTWHEGHVWSATVDLPANLAAEYKLVHFVPGQPPIWEFVPNRSLTTDAASAGMVLGLGWNDPEASALSLPMRTEATAAVAAEAGPFQTAAAAVDAFAAQFEGVGFSSAAAVAAPAETVAVIEDEEEEKQEVQAEEVEAEAEGAAATTDVAKEGKDNFLKNAAVTAGYMALGVAGAAALSVLAVDIADTAVLGAMAAVAGGAAFANSGAKSGKAGGDAEGDAAREGEGRRITGAGEPGVILAAGLLSAIDAGKAVARALDGSSASAVAGNAAAEEDA